MQSTPGRLRKMSVNEAALGSSARLSLTSPRKLANVYVEALITDDVDLPRRLPADSKNEGIKRRR